MTGAEQRILLLHRRAAVSAWLGRRKKSICPNLKNMAAVEAVKRLINEHDVLIGQFRPGVMEERCFRLK